MANKMTKRAMEKVLSEVSEPLSTRQILERLSDKRYKNMPTVHSAGQILARDKRFVKVDYSRKLKQHLWQLKEEVQ